jgi:hypothetical protein
MEKQKLCECGCGQVLDLDKGFRFCLQSRREKKHLAIEHQSKTLSYDNNDPVHSEVGESVLVNHCIIPGFCECGCGEAVRGRFVHGHNGRVQSEETRKKIGEKSKGNQYGKLVNRDDAYKQRMSEVMIAKKRLGDKATYWKGGNHEYWHRKARKLFAKNHCEICKISKDEYKKQYGRDLEMHCTGSPKDYTLLEDSNWMTICGPCHTTLEHSLRTEEQEQDRRIKISNGHIGRNKSEETKWRMSEAQKKWRVDKKANAVCK